MLDLVVEGEQNRMAIECAGDQFYAPKQWWSDKRKQRQLSRVGWDIYNLQGASFYLNPVQTKRRLEQVLEENLF